MSSLTQALASIIVLAGSVLLLVGPTNDRRTEHEFPEPIPFTPNEYRNAADEGVPESVPAMLVPPEPDRTAALPDTSENQPKSPAPRRPARRVLHRVYRVTAYCDRGATASGTRVGVGQCAAPEDIPFGSEVYIPALGRRFVVTDRTHPRFRRNTVDVFIPSEDRCLRFGRRYLDCEIRLPRDQSRRRT